MTLFDQISFDQPFCHIDTMSLHLILETGPGPATLSEAKGKSSRLLIRAHKQLFHNKEESRKTK